MPPITGILEAPLAIVDLETTGAHSSRDRVAEVAELLQGARRPRFDLDQYRILSRHLAGNKAAGRARVIELG